MHGALRVAPFAEIARLAAAFSSTRRAKTARSMATACDLTTALGTSRTIVLAGISREATCARARRGLVITTRTFAMTITHIAVGVLWTRNLALLACEALLTNALSLPRLVVHEASALVITCIALRILGTLNRAFAAHETFLALAHSGALAGVLLAGTPILTTAYTPKSILGAPQTTVTTHEACFAEALPSVGSTRDALSLTRADATLGILRTSSRAFFAQESLFALAECDLFHFVVHAFTVATADARFGGARATCIAGASLPWTHTLALSLAEFVQGALTILATHLLAETLGATLRAVVANAPILTLAASLLSLTVKKACTSARATHLPTVDESGALDHTLGACPPTSTCALRGIGRTFAGAKE